MDDQVKQVEAALQEQGIETPVETTANTETKTLTEFELEQQAKGWNPEGPKSAEEWARSEPLYEELKRRGKENKQLHRTLDNLKAMMEKQQEYAYKKAIADLTAEKNSAIARGDAERVQQIDQEAIELQSHQPIIEPQAVRDFKERHSDWFEGTSVEDIKMQAFARYQDNILLAQSLTPEQHMAKLEDEMHKAFPNYFNKTQQVAQSVEGGSSNVAGSTRSKKYTFNSLSETQKKTAREFERLNVMSVDKYIDELVKMGELK